MSVVRPHQKAQNAVLKASLMKGESLGHCVHDSTDSTFESTCIPACYPHFKQMPAGDVRLSYAYHIKKKIFFFSVCGNSCV